LLELWPDESLADLEHRDHRLHLDPRVEGGLAMIGLIWGGQPGNLVAVGARGIYTIQSLAGGRHVLQGVGHDELPMVALGPLGFTFGDLSVAQAHAASLDSELAEAHMGGE
jgi:hypothetical protein